MDSCHCCPKVCGGRWGLHGVRHDVGGRGGGGCSRDGRLGERGGDVPRAAPRPLVLVLRGGFVYGARGGAGTAVHRTAKWTPFPSPHWRHNPNVTLCWKATCKCAVPNRTPGGSRHKLSELGDPTVMPSGTGPRGSPGRGRQVHGHPRSLFRRHVPLFSPCQRMRHRTRR